MVRIYHNNRCGKSRNAFILLQNSGKPFETRLYLQETPDQLEIQRLLKLLKTNIHSIVRKKEPVYKDLFGSSNPDDHTLIAAVAEHPILLERPIIIIGEHAWIARTEKALDEIQNALDRL